jgi:hypothetical protein
MRSIHLLFVVGILLLFSGTVYSQHADAVLDYQSAVAVGGSTSEVPVGYAFDNFGPYTVYGRIWIFYSNGQSAVWQTKHFEEGGEWSGENVIPNSNANAILNVAFDGEYFHIIRSVDGDLKYRRGKAQSDGSIQFDNEVTAYSDPVWRLRSGDPRHYSVAVDHNNNVWVGLKVSDGEEADANYKPIAIASVAADGTWVDREGFPVDLAPTFKWRGNGRSQNVLEIAPGKILFVWSNSRQDNLHPDDGLRARLWDNGSLGPIEDTQMGTSSARASVVSPRAGIALLNRENEVSRRNENGIWERVDPVGVTPSNWNILTNHGDEVRLWDFNGSNIRYAETSDDGETWSALTTKWSSIDNIYHMSGTHGGNSEGSHHSVIWATGNSPYDIYMGIDGTIPLPDPPLLVSPADGTTDVTEDVTLTWEQADFAHTYEVQVSTESDFSTIIFEQAGITETSTEVTGLDLNFVHYWRVRSVTVGGTESDWSLIWSFVTVGISPAPVLTSPSDMSEDQPTSVTFVWEAAPGAETYQLQIATVQDFSVIFLDQDNISETSYAINGLDNDRTYYWRVRAINNFGEGEWSEVWSFTTAIGIPSAPVLVLPENNAENQPVTITFEWEEESLADYYRLQVSKVSDFSSTVVNVGNITASSYEVTNLEYLQTYYWRVNATNESGTGSWSQVRNFTTIIERPAVPQLSSPADSAEAVSTKPELSWGAAARADVYRVQVSADDEFTSILHDVDDFESTSVTIIDELDAFTVHYWRVNATNMGGTSDWSDPWQFTTGQAFPVAPVLVSPQDGATADGTNVLLLWSGVQTATNYRLQVSSTDDFSENFIDNDTILETFFNVSGLEPETEYFWRVRAISGVGAGDWSSVWSFLTGEATSVNRITGEIPNEYVLEQNYPNPFNPSTTIRFGLPSDGVVTLEVYNMLGQRISTLISGEYYAAGFYEAVWDARDYAGRQVSSGIYIYRISAGDYLNVKNMLFMK